MFRLLCFACVSCPFVLRQLKRKTQCPLFNEGFVVPVTKSDIRDGGVLVKVYDAEKHANHSLLGEALVLLKNYELEQANLEHIITLDLTAPTTNNGEMQLGLNYLPTSERLTIRVVKCNNVPLNNTPQQDPLLNEYAVRVLLYYKGKLVKRQKTLPRSGRGENSGGSSSSSLSSYSSKFGNPVLDESLTFDVAPSDIDNVIFVVVLCLSTTAVSSPDTPVAPSVSTESKRNYLGKVVLGSGTHGPSLHHWESMKSSPRREVIQWQTLV
ncbi:synaptotagmin-10-like [Tropilaelaps mercedesae]|uniref:Synaptotagmin-10-like n=1 Tax=Tropilaelaps mercedesae TaxID=418985 RepID=A0A1V9XJH6_9ACAR|nr:synaptotagmin-10-like [Tropilaelaps mercedesae]